MLATWAIEEVKAADLKDERLNDRLTRILSDLGDRPTASIPAACGGKAETTAAYRFFDNEKATYERVIDPHYQRTRQRMGEQKVVLLVQDTTEIDLSRPASLVDGAGPLDNSSRRGVFLHLMEAFSEDGTPLGAVWTKIWSRDEEELQKTPEEKRDWRRTAPIEEKESIRWVEGLRAAREAAAELPEVACVCVADSEADIYELFAEPRGDRGKLHWLIRACQDRGLKAEEPESSTQLYEAVSSAPVLFTQTISVRGRKAKTSCEKRSRRQPREDRTTEVEVRAATVQLRPPPRPDRKLPAVVVNVVLVREIETPEGDAPVEWILVTTLPIDDADQVRSIIHYYCVRWMIEVLFRTLKSGCRVEERRFECLDRLLPCAAVYVIVAWRTLFVCRLGRSCPDIDCEAIFEPSEWRAVYVAVHRRAAPKRPPPLGEMVRLIAQLGGYVNYANRRDPPGPQTLWLGMQRMHDLAWAWEAFGPGAKTNQKDV